MTVLDSSRVQLVSTFASDDDRTQRQRPQEARQRPSKVDPQRPLADRVADARAALYGSRAETQRRAREVREAMTASRRV